MHRAVRPLVVVSAVAVATACTSTTSTPSTAPATGIHQIKHVIVILQENRSFDTYFGTFPGADDIPVKNGVPAVCVPDPRSGSCVAPFADHADVNSGGPHGDTSATADINGGKMDGFVAQAQKGARGCANRFGVIQLSPRFMYWASHGSEARFSRTYLQANAPASCS